MKESDALKAVVITFPGSNCDQDAAHALRVVVGAQVSFVWHGQSELPAGTDLVMLPGGFSYGDALRSGAIARFSPIMAGVRRFAEGGGHVWGICNGFQVLLESHLLPGAMLQNASGRFVSRTVRMRVEQEDTPYTRTLARGRILRIPVAHHEGRYHASEETLDHLEAEGRVVFRYIDDPNGSVRSIAGICSANRRVLGMMPHPERAAEAVLGSEDGRPIFDSIAAHLAEATA
ncbi:MAG: phosphoribosylformylglycinamidine synthase subunit PurQ [Myxococcota bacterium]